MAIWSKNILHRQGGNIGILIYLVLLSHTGISPYKRSVTVTIATSSLTSGVDALLLELRTLRNREAGLIKDVKVLQLPYSGLEKYRFTEEVDVLILCHSIENRRFAITNVVDSLYDEFLTYCCKNLGKSLIPVCTCLCICKQHLTLCISFNILLFHLLSPVERHKIIMYSAAQF